MPRNGSGTYSLPAGNPVEPNTVIETEWANDTMEDIGNEITNSLSRTGEGGMLAPLRFYDGTESVPGIAWIDETSTGFYLEDAGEFAATVLTEAVAKFTSNGVTIPANKDLTVLGDQTVGGTLGVTGVITATGGVNGNITTSSATITGGTINGTAIGGSTAAAGAFTTLSASGAFSLSGDQVQVSEGGTGATTASGARTALGLAIGTDVPSPTGTGASGTWNISVSGNAATVSNGVYTNGSYSNPSWITSLAGSKITGDISGNAAGLTATLAIASGGTNATTEAGARANLLPSYATNALKFLRVNSGGTDVEWATEPSLGTVTSVAASGGTTGLSFSGSPITSSGTLTLGGTLAIASGGTGSATAGDARTALDVPSTTGSGASGTWGIGITGNAGTVTNGVYTSGSYSDPAWITSLAGSKITGNISGNAGGLSSTLGVSSGGTGQTTYTDGQLLIGNSTGNTLTKATLTAGSGITITNGNGSITVASTAGGGSVTSVDVSGGTTGLTTSGGPVTGSGTITLAGTLGVANGGTGATTLTGYVKGSGTSAFTASSTIPTSDLSGTISLTSQVTGTLPVANGGTGVTTSTGTGSVVLSASPTLTGTLTAAAGTFSGTLQTTGSVDIKASRDIYLNTNNQHLRGFTTGAVGKWLIGVNTSNKISIDADASGTVFGSSIAPAGLVDISAAGAGQIKFPATQNASSDANTLDDYEEGTFTPGITFGGAAVSMTFSLRDARYLKIGKTVVAWGYLGFTAKGSSTGAALLTGLPIAHENSAAMYPGIDIGYWSVMAVTDPIGGYLPPNGTNVVLTTCPFSSAAAASLQHTNFNNGSEISFRITYNAAA